MDLVCYLPNEVDSEALKLRVLQEGLGIQGGNRERVEGKSLVNDIHRELSFFTPRPDQETTWLMVGIVDRIDSRFFELSVMADIRNRLLDG